MAPAAPQAFVGDAVVSKGPVTLTCRLTLTLSGPDENGDGISVSHTDVAHLLASVDFGTNPGCSVLSTSSVPVTFNASTQKLTLSNMHIYTSAVPGDCEGNIVLDWSSPYLSTSGVVTVPDYTPFTGDCAVDGELEAVDSSVVFLNTPH